MVRAWSPMDNMEYGDQPNGAFGYWLKGQLLELGLSAKDLTAGGLNPSTVKDWLYFATLKPTRSKLGILLSILSQCSDRSINSLLDSLEEALKRNRDDRFKQI